MNEIVIFYSNSTKKFHIDSKNINNNYLYFNFKSKSYRKIDISVLSG